MYNWWGGFYLFIFLEEKKIPNMVWKIFYFALCQKKIKSENTNNKVVFKNIHSIKNDRKNLQEMYAVQI
jgi:hypothetical protein